MKNISLIRYSPTDANHSLTAQLVECYRNVFSGEPWNEWLKCTKCHGYWGTKDQDLLASYNFRHCNTALVDFWPRQQVVSDIYHEIVPESSCWLAINNDMVIGFCWGYPITILNLEAKLGVSFNTKLECHLKISEPVAYQDEVGVLSDYRGHKIAKAMVIYRLNDFISRGLQVGIVRTRQSPKPSETFLWYTEKLNYKIIANYPNDDGRVILGRQFSGLKELLTS